MPVQHFYQPKKLALAITLAVSCAQFTQAEEVPANVPTPGALTALLDTFINDPDTLKIPIDKKGYAEPFSERDDLLIVTGKGSFAGPVDGAGGVNVLQLDAAKGSLGDTRNFHGLEVKQGVWTRVKNTPSDFTAGVVVRPEATFTNEGAIAGHAVVEGTLINKGGIEEGAFVAAGGNLNNRGIIGGAVHVYEKGQFAGEGATGTLNVHGLLKVNQALGAATVNGDLNLKPSATLAYEVKAKGVSKTIVVAGTADLGNSTLQLTTAGDYPKSSQHTILTAGKVVGEFGRIENDLAFMTPTLKYDEKQVGLTFSRNEKKVENAASSENAGEIGKQIDQMLDASTTPVAPPEVVPVVAETTGAQVETPVIETAISESSAPAIATVSEVVTEPADTAVSVVSGEAAASIGTVVSAEAVTSAVTADPVDTSPTAETPVAVAVTVPAENAAPVLASASAATQAVPAAPATTAPTAPTAPTASVVPASVPAPIAPANQALVALLGSNRNTAALALDQLAAGSNANLAKATLSAVSPVSDSMLSAMRQLDTDARSAKAGDGNGRVWVQALGNGGKIDRDADSTLKHSTQGLVAGADWRLDEQWHVGIIGGNSQTKLDARHADGDLDSWHVGAYAVRQDGPLALRLGATYASHDGSSKRRVAFNGFSDRLIGSYDASTQQAFAELGYDFGQGDFTLEPFANLGYQRYQRDSYSEKGGDAALKVHGQSQKNLSSTFGLRVAKTNNLDNGMQLTPRLSAGWKHTYGELDMHTRQELLNGGIGFEIAGAQLDRNSLSLDAGLDLALSASHTLGMGITGDIASDSRNTGVMGQWRMAF
ncbi:autotransporter domain-containing protein [Pseudomonas sp. 18058]|uniref:autotransporter family protein n=1 Tax=Pseudomonas sp. 18058 TaxID=2681406 RepID=UPI00211447D0|nr:autotransporter domain-containing protein [Pseudomonas sp. 18058]